MSEQFDKIAALSNAKAKVNRLLLSNITDFSGVYALVEEFAADPTVENAEALEAYFNRVAHGFEAVRNALFSLAKTALSEEDPQEVDVTYDENGRRLL